MKASLLVAAAAVAWIPVVAHAETKAWTAAKAGLPAETKIVLGVDVAAVQKSGLFATAFSKLVAKLDPTNMLAKLKTSCKFDPLTTVQSVVMGTDAEKKVGAIYIGVAGFDQSKLAVCLQTAAGMAEGAKVSVKRTGDITEIAFGADTFYFGWIGTDVLVVAAETVDKAMLQKWMGGKGALAKTDVGRTLAKVNTASAVWGASAVTTEIETGSTMKVGYGSLAFAKGNVDADIHAVMATPAQASAMAQKSTAQLADMRKQGSLPAPITALLQAVTVVAARDEVVVRASVVEKDLASVLAMVMGML